MSDENHFPEMPNLEYADVEAIVDLLSRTSDPTLNFTIAERRHLLAKGLLQLASADTYSWNICVANPDIPGDAMVTSFVDGGWKDDSERNRFFHVLTHSKIAVEAGENIMVRILQGHSSTETRPQKYNDAAWLAQNNEFQQMGLSEYLLSAVPLGNEGFSCIGLHRRVGKPPFSERDRTLVHVVFNNLHWIHRHGLAFDSGKIAIRLTPREREVLLHLLRGDSQKLIASKLEISIHTVGDHMKQIYKQFEVKSRGELLGRFIAPTNP